MRDIIVFTFFAVAIIFAFRSPFIGLLLYYCFSVLAPHRFTWSYAYIFPFPMIAALVTMATSVIYYRQLKFPKIMEVYLFLIFWFFITITTIFSLYPSNAWAEWKEVSKILLMAFFIFLIVNTRQKLVFFVLAIIAFIGFLGVKGAIFGVLTRGRYLVWGPPDSYLTDNNFLGVALVMIIPLCFIVGKNYKSKWIHYALIVTGISAIISCVLTYSRGALIGLLGMGIFYIFSTRYKVITGLVAALIIVVGLNFLPEQWVQRMATIKGYQMDESAKQRINSWKFCFNLAKARPLGGGFDCYTPEQYLKYAPDPNLNIKTRLDGTVFAHTAHSIYFEVLAEHGFLGLAIYLTTMSFLLLSLQRIYIYYRKFSKNSWISAFARALFVSIIGFLISAAFVSRAYFEVFWIIFALAVCLKHIVYIDTETRAMSPEKSPVLQPDTHTEKQPA
jgi:putative inorganic carbon (HCO3(-)) transporter